MSPEEIAARNRTNAGHSIGPRTAAGKAIVAQNARVHGATGQPDPGRVATWLRVILDAPDLSLGEVLGDDPRMRAALALAEAEVRVETAERGWREAMTHQPYGDTDSFVAALLREARGATPEEIQELIMVRLRQLEAQAMDPRRLERRQRLAERYLREARAQRRRAFSSWIAALGSKSHEGGRDAVSVAA